MTSIIENNKSANISIYPNPVKESLFFNSGINAPMPLEIADILGKIVLRKDMEKQNSVVEIDVNMIPAGLYFLKLGNEIKKFVKE
jgi:hypothetical protein